MNSNLKAPPSFFVPVAALLLAWSPGVFAAIPAVEKLLPADTLLVFNVPDSARLRGIIERSPQYRLWNDAAMKPFHDHVVLKWDDEFLKPLERDLGVKLADYTPLLQGQLALAVTQDGWPGNGDAEPGLLLLLDAREKSGQLKTNLTELRKKWTDAGKAVQTEKIRDVEFSILALSSNDVPATLKKFFPQKQEIQELGREPAKKSADNNRLVIGQFESLLILGSSVRTVEGVVAHLTGGNAPALADEPAFEQNRLALFRDAATFAWFNGKRVFDVLGKLPPEKPNPQAPDPLPMPGVAGMLNALGLGGLKTLAFAFRDQPEGTTMELFIGAPESARNGLVKLLAVETKESSPPPFVPADAVKFQRWRLDGPKTVATLEKMLGEISPQFLGTWNFLIQSGESAMKQTNPDFDLRKNVFASLGDDLITYEKPPRGDSPAELAAPPSLFALAAPNAEALARALSGVLVMRFADALTPKEREFLGKKIFSVAMPSAGKGDAGLLNYTASGGYVAFSSDAGLIEEFIRSAESPVKPLKETPGLADAAQRVGGQGTGVFSYENEVESMRAAFALFKKMPTAPAGKSDSSNPLTDALPYTGPEKSFRDWLDYSLLPDFAKVSQYFHFSIWAGAVNADGITFKFHSPTPPGAKL